LWHSAALRELPYHARAMATPVRSALLRGADHHKLGGIAVVAEAQLGIALSRGGAPKRYAHREPNEDVVGFAWTEWAAVLVVADGHAGCAAADLAVERALAFVPRWLERAPIALDGRFAAEAQALVRAAQEQILTDPRVDGSRTTLALALARPREGWLGLVSIGDSLLFTYGDAGARSLVRAPETPIFLGTGRLDAAELAAATWIDVRPLRGERALVLASDGFSQEGIGVADPEAAVSQVARQAARAAPELRSLALARGLVACALEAQREQGAGDNVAAAALWLGPPGA
jgi:serine/threonine protein phosphatase PrpC